MKLNSYKKESLIACLLFFIMSNIIAQEPIDRRGVAFKEIALFTGYSFNFGDSLNKKSHVIEFGIWKSNYITHVEPFSLSYYYSTELIFHDKKLANGIKFGGFMGFWMLCLGSEIAYYTDFKENSIQITPYFGWGTNFGKITLNPHLTIYNKSFDYLNPMSLSITFQIKSLWKKQLGSDQKP